MMKNDDESSELEGETSECLKPQFILMIWSEKLSVR